MLILLTIGMQAMLLELNRKVDIILTLVQGGRAAVKEENSEFMVSALYTDCEYLMIVHMMCLD